MRASRDLRVFAMVLDRHARAVIVTDRVRVTRETSDGSFSSTFLYEPVDYRHAVSSAAIDLGPAAKARVIFGDVVRIAGTHRHEARVFLLRER